MTFPMVVISKTSVIAIPMTLAIASPATSAEDGLSSLSVSVQIPLLGLVAHLLAMLSNNFYISSWGLPEVGPYYNPTK